MQMKQFYNIATKVSSRRKVLLLLVIYLTAQSIDSSSRGHADYVINIAIQVAEWALLQV